MPLYGDNDKPIRLLVGLGLVGLLLAVVVGGLLPRWWIAHFDLVLYRENELGTIVPLAAYYKQIVHASSLGILRLYTAALLVLAGLTTLLWLRGIFGRSPGSLLWTHLAFGCAYTLVAVVWLGLASYVDTAHGAELYATDIFSTLSAEDASVFGMDKAAFYQSGATGYPLLALTALVVLHVFCSTSPIYAYHGVELPGPAPGDRVLEFVRIGGVDPRWARSLYSSLGGHLLLIFGPFLLAFMITCFQVEDYKLPPGSGKPSTPQITAIKIVKKKRYVLAKDSIYIFKDPTPKDSKVIKKIDKISQRIYDATASGTPGALGTGGGDTGGFGGPPGGELRFIRIKFDCRKWDDGMTIQTGDADKNFLRWYKDLPNVKFPVRQHGESHPIGALDYYTPGFAPPFIYMTGESRGRISSKEVKVLKNYLKNGGLLLVDAGSSEFHRWFTSWVRCLTSGNPLVTISDDDPVFSIGYPMNNIDPLFPHGGAKAKAMGHKYQGRWVIFYHPGDMNDAWKNSATKVPRRIRDNAKRVAYNVIYYAIINYMKVNRKHYAK